VLPATKHKVSNQQATMEHKNTIAEQVYANLNLDLVVLAKDKNSRYIFASEAGTQLLGADAPQQIVGKKDCDLYWRKYADIFVAGDNIVMSNRPYVNVPEPVIAPTKNGIRKFLVTKTPLLDQYDKCGGIILVGLDITNYFIKNKSLAFKTEGKKFCLGKFFNNEYLTKREVDVLKCILLGYPLKYVGKLLSVSSRTVETHLTCIKQKMQCRTKGDVIVAAIKTGLNFTILDSDCWEYEN
jgi:DNA-binding CsgD family transcriptional regulator